MISARCPIMRDDLRQRIGCNRIILTRAANIAQFPKLKSERISNDRLGLPPKDVDFWAAKLRVLVSGSLISEEC